MLAFAVAAFPYLPGRTSNFHHAHFHGFPAPRVARHPQAGFLGHPAAAPLRLARNVWRVPDVFHPPGGSLVLAPAVRRKLEVVPHVGFRPVEWGHVFALPYPPGDFSHDPVSPDPDDPDYNSPRRHALRQPHRPELAEDVTGYSEMLVYRLKDVADGFPDAAPRPYRLGRSATRANAPRLSPGLLREYPVLWDYHYVFSEPAFRLVRPHLDPDHFEVAEVVVE